MLGIAPAGVEPMGIHNIISWSGIVGALAGCTLRPSSPDTMGLAGTWVGSGTRAGGGTETITVVLEPNRLEIAGQRDALVATKSASGFDVVYDARGDHRMSARHTSADASMNAGANPIRPSGQWDISSVPENPELGCSATIRKDNIAAGCRAFDEPSWFPQLAHGLANCVKSETQESLFGDFGGIWTCTSSGGGTCRFTFAGNTIASSCRNADKLSGTMQVLFGESLVSGSTSAGIEFSAQRR